MATPATMALTELAAKGADVDFIKQTLQFALQRLMEMDVEALCKAAYGERSEERINSRNGYASRCRAAILAGIGLVDLPEPPSSQIEQISDDVPPVGEQQVS